MKLGKTPAIYSPRTLKLKDFLIQGVSAPPNRHFGFDDVVAVGDWGMLGNDEYGDCVWASAAHQHMLWEAARLKGQPATKVPVFSTENVLADYAAVTGFNPVTGANDNGTNILDALNYRRNTGLKAQDGSRKKIAAYASLTPGNPEELKQAIWTFGAVELGIEVPSSMFDQFDANKPLTVVKGSPIEGGHDIPSVGHFVGFGDEYFDIITWGKRITMSVEFFEKYNDEGYAILASDFLRNGQSVRGVDVAALQEALADL